MKKQDQDTTLELDLETLAKLNERDREDAEDLFEIAFDVIDTTGCINRDGIKQWLPAYSRYRSIKAALHPAEVNAVLDRAIQEWNK